MLKTTVLLSLLCGVFAADPKLPFPAEGNGDRLLSYNETTPYARMRPRSTSVKWSSAGDVDGQYITTNDKGDLVRQDIVTGNSTVFLPVDQIPEDMREYWIGSGDKHILFATNATKLYRHSYNADYFIHDTETGEKTPLVADQAGDIQLAKLAPAGGAIAFVRGNDLYIRDADGNIERITDNGSPDMFNGVADWVYEEEVIAGSSTTWFSPDGKYLAFLSLNETGVGTYSIPYYMDNQKIAPVYPNELELRYPKVGTTNPRVSMSIVNVETHETKPIELEGFGDETIIGEVAWITDAHSKLIYRAFNRVQDEEKHVTVDAESSTSKVVRTRDGTDGWLENLQAIQYVGRVRGTCNQTYYVDLSDESGYLHIYLYPVNGGKAIQLTSGDWEVASISYVDTARKQIFFTAAKRHSTERHLYSVSFATKKVTPLVDDAQPASFSASFSTKGGYYILSYGGPQIPYQQLYSSNSTTPIRTLQTNEEFYNTIQEYNLPNTTWTELQHPEGFSLNVKQTLPPNFDPTKKYPVLFNPYGGPNAQSAAKTFPSLGWTQYIASDPELQFIVYVVDNRGTGFKGRKFRSAVTRQLGTLEPLDQIWALEQLASQHSYIDTNKVGMWGWSYGGYLTAKTVEQDSGAFTFGLITAPVSDFRFYDSVYTERYMKTLEGNADGYAKTAVRNTAGFKNIAGGVAIMHGTGDDNVHYQNAAALVDLLVGDKVSPSKMKMMAFTDSDHGISYNGASDYIYKFLTARLWDEVQRTDEKMVHQWTRRKEQLN
ncbi:dipeptidylpeptidase [Lecanicillium sp. MT-2017a]|nr:dipeptidylpeptidase [Lecanicillium sp. MT-2017a]